MLVLWLMPFFKSTGLLVNVYMMEREKKSFWLCNNSCSEIIQRLLQAREEIFKMEHIIVIIDQWLSSDLDSLKNKNKTGFEMLERENKVSSYI